jgi:hypothetical protein
MPRTSAKHTLKGLTLSGLSHAISADEDGFLPYGAFALFVTTVLCGCITAAALISHDCGTSAIGSFLTLIAGGTFADTLERLRSVAPAFDQR